MRIDTIHIRTFGLFLEYLLDGRGVSKASICKELGISRTYLYSVISGEAPAFSPERQWQLVDLLHLVGEERFTLFDLAASERNEVPADIVSLCADRRIRDAIRKIGNRGIEENALVTKRRPKLAVPCCFQGGKQRVSAEIVETIFDSAEVDSSTVFYDLCSGSGAVTIELINHGVDPSRIVMVDISSWAAFWSQIGAGSFDMNRLDEYLSQIPEDKHLIKGFMAKLSEEDAAVDEAYKYILLQASSFGGKQIWREGHAWKNAFFRSYWEPKEGCVRTSPANPIQPSPSTLRKRVSLLANYCRGLRVVRCDIREFSDFSGAGNSVLYMDPPYRGTTGYGFDFDLQQCISNLREMLPSAPFFVSEGYQFASEAYHLNFKGAKGGISGNRRGKHEEWLNVIE